MSTWRISLKKGMVLIEFLPGTKVNADLLQGVNQELNSEPERYRTTNSIWDFRDTVPDQATGFDELTKVVKRFKSQRKEGWGHTKSALVVNDKVTFGMTRMYTSLAENNLNYQVRIFENDLRAAFAWAGSAE